MLSPTALTEEGQSTTGVEENDSKSSRGTTKATRMTAMAIFFILKIRIAGKVDWPMASRNDTHTKAHLRSTHVVEEKTRTP